MAKAPLFDPTGKKSGEFDLSEGLFGVEANVSLIHQKVVAERNAARQGTSNTLGRSDVRGGGKKPYRQKGTGRARQGTIRAPHYYHGGIVFGPHPRDYTQKMPKKMRQGAIRSALAAKAESDQIIIVEDFSLPKISTKEAAAFLKAIEVNGKALVVVAERDEVLLKSVRNIPNVVLRVASDLCARDIVNGGQLVVTRAAVGRMEELWAE